MTTWNQHPNLHLHQGTCLEAIKFWQKIWYCIILWKKFPINTVSIESLEYKYEGVYIQFFSSPWSSFDENGSSLVLIYMNMLKNPTKQILFSISKSFISSLLENIWLPQWLKYQQINFWWWCQQLVVLTTRDPWFIIWILPKHHYFLLWILIFFQVLIIGINHFYSISFIRLLSINLFKVKGMVHTAFLIYHTAFLVSKQATLMILEIFQKKIKI